MALSHLVHPVLWHFEYWPFADATLCSACYRDRGQGAAEWLVFLSDGHYGNVCDSCLAYQMETWHIFRDERVTVEMMKPIRSVLEELGPGPTCQSVTGTWYTPIVRQSNRP